MGKRTNTAKWMENQKRWQINVQKDGVRRSFTSSKPGRTGQREANAKADAWLDDGIEIKRYRVSDLYELYMEDIDTRTSKSNSIKERKIAQLYVLPIIGKKNLQSLSDQDLQDVINAAVKKDLARKTISCIRASMMGFCKFCRRKKVSTYIPDDVIIPKSVRSKEKNILQPENLLVLFSSDKTIYHEKEVVDPFIHAYRFQVLTGLRPGELMGLRWSDIRGDVIHLQRSINILNEVTAGKNQNAIRAVNLTIMAQEVLQQQRKISRSESIFEISNGDHYRKRFKVYCEHNNIPYVPPYNLRHTFVSVAKTLPEGQVKSIVGHSKDMDTFGVYGHELRGDGERVALELQNIFQTLLLMSDKKKNVL